MQNLFGGLIGLRESPKVYPFGVQSLEGGKMRIVEHQAVESCGTLNEIARVSSPVGGDLRRAGNFTWQQLHEVRRQAEGLHGIDGAMTARIFTDGRHQCNWIAQPLRSRRKVQGCAAEEVCAIEDVPKDFADGEDLQLFSPHGCAPSLERRWRIDSRLCGAQ
jgi:hypothetical protein